MEPGLRRRDRHRHPQGRTPKAEIARPSKWWCPPARCLKAGRTIVLRSHFEERSRSLNPASNVDRKEEPNVERFVRDPRIVAYDLCWDRCRAAYDGRGVTGPFGNGRRHLDRGGLQSALQRDS